MTLSATVRRWFSHLSLATQLVLLAVLPAVLATSPLLPPVAVPDTSDPSEARRLDRGGDPLEALRQLLRDAAAG